MLNELLHKYLYKQPSKDDARSIKRWIDTASEPEIEQALLQEWEKHTVSEPRNWHTVLAQAISALYCFRHILRAPEL